MESLVYTFFTCISFILAFICVIKINRKKYSMYSIIPVFCIASFNYYIGAKLTSILENIITHQIYSNYVYTGGLILGIVSIIVCAKFLEENITDFLAHMIIMFPVIYTFSKIGCYMAGCCKGVFIIPLQLIESFVGISLVYIILKGLKKEDERIKIVLKYLLVFAITRFLLDFFRVQRYSIIFNLTITQILCIFLVCIEIFFILLTKRIGGRNNNESKF